MRLIACIFLITALGACSSSPNLGKQQCQSYDWFEVGKRDGSEGKTFRLIDKYAKECKKYKVTPVEQKYVAGYLEGMKIFCTEENGYKDGLKAARAVNTCPRESKYFEGYEKGLAIIVEESERREVERITRPGPDNGQRTGNTGL